MSGADGDDQERFFDEYAAQVLLKTMGEKARSSEDVIDGTLQDAAWEMIEMAVVALRTHPISPLPVNQYLLSALEKIVGGEDAGKAFGICATRGNIPVDNDVKLAIVAHVEMLRRREPSNGSARSILAKAKKDTLDAIMEATGVAYDQSQLDRLWKEFGPTQSMALMSDEELAAVADLAEIKSALREPYNK